MFALITINKDGYKTDQTGIGRNVSFLFPSEEKAKATKSVMDEDYEIEIVEAKPSTVGNPRTPSFEVKAFGKTFYCLQVVCNENNITKFGSYDVEWKIK